MKVVSALYPNGDLAMQHPDLLGCAENGPGLWDALHAHAYEYISLTGKEKQLDEHLPTADVLILTPCWPAYMT
jgi:formate dehydrogenase